MNPRHHPSSDIIAAYAAGTLEPGFGLVVSAHLETCGHCRRLASNLHAASGAALAALQPASMAGDALTRTMARLDLDAAPPIPVAQSKPLIDRLPLLPRKHITPGVWVAAVDTPHATENRVYVLSVSPGWPTARHEHVGMEFCTVLSGAFRDELGLFKAGDFAAADADVDHHPVIEGDEPCICLFATEGRLKPRGFFGQLAFAYANV